MLLGSLSVGKYCPMFIMTPGFFSYVVYEWQQCYARAHWESLQWILCNVIHAV